MGAACIVMSGSSVDGREAVSLAGAQAPGPHTWSSSVVALPDGDLAYRQVGVGPLLLAVHGIQGTSDAWTDVAERLASDFTVVAPDMRGREPSMTPDAPEGYSMDRFASDLEALVADVGTPTVLMGWSMGVLIALEYLQRVRSLPDAVILVGGSAALQDDARWFEGSSPADVAAEAAERAQRLGLTRAATPDAVAASWWHAQRCDYSDVLSGIDTPALVLHGADDDQCPLRHGELLADGLPCAELHVWDQCGHNPMSHDADRFASAVRDFTHRRLERGLVSER